MKDIAKQKIGKPQIELKEGAVPARERVTHFMPVWSWGNGFGTTCPEPENRIIDRGK